MAGHPGIEDNFTANRTRRSEDRGGSLLRHLSSISHCAGAYSEDQIRVRDPAAAGFPATYSRIDRRGIGTTNFAPQSRT